MKRKFYQDEDLTTSVKRVLKEAAEEMESEAEAEGSEIANIADAMDVDVDAEEGVDIEADDVEIEDEVEDEVEGEEESIVTLEMPALVDLVGEESAQKLYDKCAEKGPGVPLTTEDVEECCPAMEEPTEEEGELEGYEEGLAVGTEEEDEGQEEVDDFVEGFEDATDADIEGSEDVPAGEDVEGGCMTTGAVAAGTDAEGGADSCAGGEDLTDEDIADIEAGLDRYMKQKN